MKKKKSYLVLLCLFIFTTGCMRQKVDMAIHKDKSMDVNMDVGISKVFIDAYNRENQNGTTTDEMDMDFLSEEDLEEMRKAGVQVDKYDDGKYTGMKMLLKVKNIDAISSSKEVTGDLESLLGKATKQEEMEDVYFFTVKKGFLKNKYIAKLNMSLTDEPMDNLLTDEDATTGADTTDYSSLLASGMEIGFSIELPYKAKSNNATTVENDGKKLSWDLTQFQDSVEFSFELYNRTNFYILGASVLLILLILIMIIVLFTRKRRNKKIPDSQVDMSRGTKEQYYSISNQEPIPVASSKQEISDTASKAVAPVGQPNSIPSSLRVEPPINRESDKMDMPNPNFVNGGPNVLPTERQAIVTPSQPVNPMPIPSTPPSVATSIPTPNPSPLSQPQVSYPNPQPQPQVPSNIPMQNPIPSVQPTTAPLPSGQPQMIPQGQNGINLNQPPMNTTQMANQIPTNNQQRSLPLQQDMPAPIPSTNVQNRQEGNTQPSPTNPMDIFGQTIDKDVNQS